MPQILVNLTDHSRRRVFREPYFERLAQLGEIILFDPGKDDAFSFPALVARADVVLTCWGSRPLTATDLDGRDPRPLLLAHSAGSVRGILARELLNRGVRLTQSAMAMVSAVAQLTLGLMVLALRQAVYRSALLSRGDRSADTLPYYDLEGLTVGLIGLSRVGSKVAELLPPFGAGRILAYDPYCTAERAEALGVTLLADLDEVLTQSDVVSLHAPVTPETTNLLDARRVGLLKTGGALINTARAQLVDQDALFERAIKGELEVYTDVTTPEPFPPDHPAWQSPHIFITPHIAGPTQQTLRRMVNTALEEIERFLKGEPLLHEVTFDRYDILG